MHPAPRFLGLFLLLVLGTRAAAPARPNILWVVSEDNTFNFVGAYGDPLARTPAIDGLARHGVLFTNARSAAPVCAPSRSTIITGVYAASLGTEHMRSGYPLPPEVKFFPEYLRAAGYYCTNRHKTDYNTSTPYDRAWDECSPDAHWRNRAPGQPFFAIFNFEDSHESRLHTRTPLVTDPAKVRVPAYLPDTAEVRADLAQYYDCVSRADAKIGEILQQLAADGLADDTIVFYYSDNGGCLPRSKRFMFDNGTHVAMAAYFPPKYRHLAPAAPGSRVDAQVGFADLAPTVLTLAGLPIPSYMQGRAIAGARPGPAPAYGFTFRGRMDERFDHVRAISDGRYHYIRNYRPDLSNGRSVAFLHRQSSMREWAALEKSGRLDPARRAFFLPRPAEQLFDCQSDPDNVRDLATDPAQQDRVLRFRASLRAQLLAIRDAGFLPEPLRVELAAGSSPTRITRSDTAYPLAELIDLVDTLQLGPPAPGRIDQLLRHPLPVFRYWAVVAGLSAAAPPNFAPVLRDPDATVRLAAAEGILHSRQPGRDAAWREVTSALTPAHSPALRLTAANLVADYPDAPASTIAALQAQPALKDKFYAAYFANLVAQAAANRPATHDASSR